MKTGTIADLVDEKKVDVSARPKRILRKRYDAVNMRWIVRYYRLGRYSVKLQEFETTIMQPPGNYVGRKFKVDEAEFGYEFVKELAGVCKCGQLFDKWWYAKEVFSMMQWNFVSRVINWKLMPSG